MLYLGHLYFVVAMLIYAWAVKKDRKYILGFLDNGLSKNIGFGLAGALLGFVLMGICILAGVISGTLTVSHSTVDLGLFILAIFAVIIQVSAEEVESRGFVFGKMYEEGVPVIASLLVSSFFFSCLHVAKPGFSFHALLNIFLFGLLFALSYFYTRNICFPCGIHMMWNFTQDFIVGMPNSGTPSALSLFSTAAKDSPVFFDQTFGIEGSYMATAVAIIGCVINIAIGERDRRIQKN